MDNSSQLFSLKWNNYLSHIMDAFEMLRSEENLVDVTLSCEGYKIKAHKMLLSACSSYFKDLFKDNPCQHPIVVFRNVRFYDLRALIDFIYQGEVNVMQDQLASFLATAKLLEVKGLTDNNFGSADDGHGNQDSESFEDENVSENIDDEEVDEDENLSDASQYAQPSYPQEVTSGPLTIIPINRNAAEPSPEYTAVKKKRKTENEDEGYQRRQQMPSMKPIQRVANNEGSPLSFKTKQSVEIFPVPPLIKVEKLDESYHGDTALKDSTRVDRLPECEIQNVEYKVKMTSMDENYVKTHLELNQLLSKSSHGAADNDMPQDSLQGHWLSSLNNGADGNESVTNESGVTIANRKSTSSDTNVDFSQQRHRYICSICGATYKHLRNLRAHCHLHYGKTRCNLCNKVLCNISYFKKHLQQQHGLLTTKKTDAKSLSSPSVALPST